MDPFNANRLALRCADSIIFVNDFRPGSKSSPPSGQGQKFYFSGSLGSDCFGVPGSQSPSPSGASSAGLGVSPIVTDHYHEASPGDKTKMARSRLKNMVKELVTGEPHQPNALECYGRMDASALTDCLQVSLELCRFRGVLLFYYYKDI